MKPEIIKTNEKIKIGLFLSIFGILVFMLSSYLVYFYNTYEQRLLRDDNATFLCIAIALFFLIKVKYIIIVYY